ncbi:hypothetical protein M405DRAFT_883558 [Rhizopogon salebrosus TDB-379]|nr:hypothetical protein M405DRAFT_883558 [Rhizopogon salebrosus TDB-379]
MIKRMQFAFRVGTPPGSFPTTPPSLYTFGGSTATALSSSRCHRLQPPSTGLPPPPSDYSRKLFLERKKMRGGMLALAFEFTGKLWRGRKIRSFRSTTSESEGAEKHGTYICSTLPLLKCTPSTHHGITHYSLARKPARLSSVDTMLEDISEVDSLHARRLRVLLCSSHLRLFLTWDAPSITPFRIPAFTVAQAYCRYCLWSRHTSVEDFVT